MTRVLALRALCLALALAFVALLVSALCASADAALQSSWQQGALAAVQALGAASSLLALRRVNDLIPLEVDA